MPFKKFFLSKSRFIGQDLIFQVTFLIWPVLVFYTGLVLINSDNLHV